jgi:beta-lactamase regulating signal transducer with metallopeptidase domain
METFAIILSCWLLTYFLHSTAFYGLAKLLIKFPAFAHNRAKEILWKVALCGGLLTASIQVFTGTGIFTSPLTAQNEVITNTVMTENPQNLAGKNTENLLENQEVSEDMATSDLSNPTASNPIESESVARELSIFEIAVFAWLAIVGLLVVRLFVQKYLFFKAILPREKVKDENLLFTLFKLCSWGGIEQKIVLTFSEKLYSPLAMGKGEICLPARTFTELSPEQQQSMLAHELAHVVHKDYLWLKFFNFLETALFFQPLNRLMRIELQEVTEQRCDEWAIRSTGNAKPLADCLVKVAEWITEPNALRFASGMALHQSSLRQRIMNILKNQYLTQKELNRMKVIVILILLFVFTTFILPGKTWLSISFAHNSKFANLFHHQEIGIGDASNDEKEISLPSLPPLAEIEEIEIPEPPEVPAPLAAVELPNVLAHTPIYQADTLRFGNNFMLITKGNGNFEIYKDGKFIEEEDYGKYKDDFIVRNDRSIEIVAKNGVVVSTGKEEYFPKTWAWSSPRVITIPPVPLARVWSDAFGDSWSSGFNYGFSTDEGYSHYWEENGDRIEMDFDKDDNLKQLRINGKKIEKADFPKHQKLIDKAKENVKKDKARVKKHENHIPDYEATMRDAMRKGEEEMRKAQRELENLQRGLQGLEEITNKNQIRARQLEEKAREQERKSRETSNRVLEELVKDGLIKSKDARYDMRLNKRGLFIDDEKQSDALFQKYKKLLKDLMGIDIEDGGNFMLSN